MSSSPIEQDPSSTQTFGVVDVANSVDSPVVGLSQQDAAIAALPVATVVAGGELPLTQGINPAWAEAMASDRSLRASSASESITCISPSSFTALAAVISRSC